MDATDKIQPKYQDVDGFCIPRWFPPEALLSCLRYKPRAEDIFIVTYPKCGTTWTQQIVRLILHKGESFKDGHDFFISSPFLELAGADAADIMPRPGGIKLHLPFYMTPYSSEAKYIFVARNPKDTCVSFYHHHRLLPMYDFADGEFDVFFDYFINGKTDFGEYFDTHLTWYEKRNDANVLYLTFEDLKKQPSEGILKIAKFLGKEYHDELLKSNSLLKTVIEKSSFQYMKEHYQFYDELYGCLSEAVKQGKILSSGYRQFVANVPKSFLDSYKGNTGSFFRKGEVGDWKELFTEDHSRRLREKIADKTKDSDFMALWKDLKI